MPTTHFRESGDPTLGGGRPNQFVLSFSFQFLMSKFQISADASPAGRPSCDFRDSHVWRILPSFGASIFVHMMRPSDCSPFSEH